MIIWLASYPRSGNTLLRTVFRETLDMPSFTDTPGPKTPEDEKNAVRAQATADLYRSSLPENLTRDWQRFYPYATESKDVFLVKTHSLPIDGQPYIYVIRDGRSSIASHYRFHLAYHADVGRSLTELVVGADYYGLWCDHMAPWTENRPQTRGMVVRFDELKDASPALVRQLADFVGTKYAPRPWSNPLEAKRKVSPDFFGHGSVVWERPNFWDDQSDALFWLIHGSKMVELGYAPPAQIAEVPDAIHELALIATCESRLAHRLQWECDQRLRVIEALQGNTARRKGGSAAWPGGKRRG
jgi:hypothetical protein